MPTIRASGASPLRLLVGSFLALILSGTLLLKLPVATPADQPISLTDAFFTATSATCVTGLVVRDTGTGFTFFGQVVIALLIQLGGLGIMTFSLLFFFLIRGRVSLAHRSIIEQTLSGRAGEELLPLIRMVFRFTLISEGAGALLLWIRWWGDLGPGRAAWYAVFHSISGFCNAGFALWPDSLTRYRGDPLVNLVMMALIVLGGLGFLVVYDVWQAPRKGGRISIHTKLALVVSALLIAGGALGFWLLEWNGSLAHVPPGEQLWASFFQSVTTRTAGFNTVPIASLSPGALFLMTLLMFIGGSPGSCAGGIKTTTLAVLALASWSRVRGRERVNVFRRTLSAGTVRDTLSIALAGALVVVAGLFALLLLESPDRMVREDQGVFLGYLFETVSALGTVGLSTGVTSMLLGPSRWLVAFLMFLGRLGPLTVASAVASTEPLDDWSYPEEDVMVG